MTIHNNPDILEVFGKYVSATLFGIERSLKAVDQKIQLVYLKKEHEFLLLSSHDIKKEAIQKELTHNLYFLWKPVMTNQTDKEGNYIIRLAANNEDSKSASDIY
jgi:hypothetical protein